MSEDTPPTAQQPKGLEHATDDPSVSELRGQQQQEMSTAVLGSEGQWHGAVLGVVLGGIVGLVLLTVIAFVFFDADSPARFVLPVLGFLFGAVSNGVYQGGRNPEREGELLKPSGAPDESTAVASNPPEANEH